MPSIFILCYLQVRHEYFIEFCYNIVENTVIFQSSLHLCQWSSSIVEQETVFPPTATGSGLSTVLHCPWNAGLTECLSKDETGEKVMAWGQVCGWRVGAATLSSQILWWRQWWIHFWMASSCHKNQRFWYFLWDEPEEDEHSDFSTADFTVVPLGNNFTKVIIPKYCSHYFPSHNALLYHTGANHQWWLLSWLLCVHQLTFLAHKQHRTWNSQALQQLTLHCLY